MPSLITEPELMEWTGHRRRDPLVNWLRQQGIPYLLGKNGRICCTADAVNLPLRQLNTSTNDAVDDIEFL